MTAKNQKECVGNPWSGSPIPFTLFCFAALVAVVILARGDSPAPKAVVAQPAPCPTAVPCPQKSQLIHPSWGADPDLVVIWEVEGQESKPIARDRIHFVLDDRGLWAQSRFYFVVWDELNEVESRFSTYAEARTFLDRSRAKLRK